MFGEKERSFKVIEGEPQTLLDSDAQFEGKLTFEGKVQINGKFRGEIFSAGTLIIGEGAEVDAQIEIDTAIIKGQVSGFIRAKSRIEMHPPAVVKGDIASPGLVISEGAIFEGSCSMGRDQGQVFAFQRKEVAEVEPEVFAADTDEDELEEVEAEFHSVSDEAHEGPRQSSFATEAEF